MCQFGMLTLPPCEVYMLGKVFEHRKLGDSVFCLVFQGAHSKTILYTGALCKNDNFFYI